MRQLPVLILSMWMTFSLHAQVNEDLPAFPQAEGFGAYALGGRGGKVIFVENLHDEGPGSLRAAVKDSEPRIVIFRVSGTIELQSNLVVNNPFITIAGHTAPGDGICLKNHTLDIRDTHDVIIRGIRVRPGIQALEGGKSNDGIDIQNCQDVIIDHCSASWSTDEILNTYKDNEDITVQWCIFSESLNNSVHHKGEHGYAATIGGTRASYHHNLLAHNKGRNPSIGGNRDRHTENLDFRNNVVYNWVNRVCDGKPRSMNFVGNYYLAGPATDESERHLVAEIQPADKYGYSPRWFIQDNFLNGFPAEQSSATGSQAVVFSDGTTVEKNRVYIPFEHANYRTRDADHAYLEVLDHAGVTVPRRDPVDERVIGDVRSGKAAVGNGIIDHVEQVGGWPELRTYEVPEDSDRDGMPDDWEKAEGLNIRDPWDRYWIKEGEVYDNLERYLNELASDQASLLPPLRLVATQQNEEEVVLQWQDITDEEQGFVIQRSGPGGTFSNIDTVFANQTSFTDLPPRMDRDVEYRVIAISEGLQSIPSRAAGIELFSDQALRLSRQLPAFPQAEGFGAYALGGRGGKVIFVDNLNDDGPGSLRAAIRDQEPRIVIFRISGTIELQSHLMVKHPYITIAGHTAPGDGICLKNYPLKIHRTHDVIVRGIRIRPGTEALKAGGSTDGIAVEFCRNVIVDHCSAGWSTDEILNTNNRNSDITIQWSIFSESLNNSTQGREHGYAATLGGERTSIHHNLLAHNKGRNPSIGGGDRGRESKLDIRNNVVYNWVSRVCDGKPHEVNLVGNYYKSGPATPSGNRMVVAEIQNSHEKYGFHSQWHIGGNHVDGFPAVSADNWNGAVRFRSGCSTENNRADAPFENAGYHTRDAALAYQEVLEHAGVIVPRRDPVDERVIGEVRSGTATFGKGIIDKVEEVGGWPELRTYDVPVDTDQDGMPDVWEKAEGLKMNDPSDRLAVKEGKVYDNLERYLNQLASDKASLLPPLNLAAEIDHRGGVALRWQDITEGELGFVIQRTGPDGTFISIDTVDAGESTFRDVPPGPDRMVSYRVFAMAAGMKSIPSRPVSITYVARVTTDLPAFPQAEGFGAYALGGRGGKVIFVDNLKDDGPGSLRAAVLDPEPRIVIFRVSGTIELQSNLTVKHPYITIAGHTAPGDGICLKNYPLIIKHSNDVIVRGIRVRPGIELLSEGGSNDGIAVEWSRNVIIDHCSASWSTDEILNTNKRNFDITVQWSIFSESLNNALAHKGEHGYAATLGGTRTSIHHNLLAHNKGRNPSIGGGDRGRESKLDIRNNVVYNWISRVCDGKPHTANFVANYYKPGPATPQGNKTVVAEIQNAKRYGFQSQWYIEDNFVDGFPQLTTDNWSGAVRLRSGCSMKKNRAYQPFEAANYQTRDAALAYQEVLEHAGVIVPRRDPVDERVIGEVRSGTATFGKGIIDKVEEVGGWPELRTYDVPLDTDQDGMPDAWEKAEGLNIHDPSDRHAVSEGKVYDNLERYLNQLASDQPSLLPPIQLQVTRGNNSDLLLTWTDITDGEQGFVIQRTGSDGTFITLDKVGAGVTAYTDAHPGSHRTESYRVFAFDGEMISLASKPAYLASEEQ